MLAVPATNLSRSSAMSSLRRAPRPAVDRASILKGLRREMLPDRTLIGTFAPATPSLQWREQTPDSLRSFRFGFAADVPAIPCDCMQTVFIGICLLYTSDAADEE